MPRYVRAQLEEAVARVSARLPAGYDLRVEYQDGASLLYEVKTGRLLQSGTIRSLSVYLEAMEKTLEMLSTHV